MTVFAYLPDSDVPLDEKPNVAVTKFGDGYEARQEIGLNPSAKKWSPSFTVRTTAEKDEIVNFFRARRAVESFDWVDPEGNTGKYVCRAWSPRRIRYNLWSVSCTFEEVFEP